MRLKLGCNGGTGRGGVSSKENIFRRSDLQLHMEKWMGSFFEQYLDFVQRSNYGGGGEITLRLAYFVLVSSGKYRTGS